MCVNLYSKVQSEHPAADVNFHPFLQVFMMMLIKFDVVQ